MLLLVEWFALDITSTIVIDVRGWWDTREGKGSRTTALELRKHRNMSIGNTDLETNIWTEEYMATHVLHQHKCTTRKQIRHLISTFLLDMPFWMAETSKYRQCNITHVPSRHKNSSLTPTMSYLYLASSFVRLQIMGRPFLSPAEPVCSHSTRRHNFPFIGW